MKELPNDKNDIILFNILGRQYDGTGNLSPWWSEETLEVIS